MKTVAALFLFMCGRVLGTGYFVYFLRTAQSPPLQDQSYSSLLLWHWIPCSSLGVLSHCVSWLACSVPFLSLCSSTVLLKGTSPHSMYKQYLLAWLIFPMPVCFPSYFFSLELTVQPINIHITSLCFYCQDAPNRIWSLHTQSLCALLICSQYLKKWHSLAY